MQLDTDNNGLAAIFKTWQVPLVEELLAGTSMKSKEAHTFLEERGIKAGARGRRERGTVSRAGIIAFFNYMVDEGLLDYTERTAKGGHHRIYKVAMTREAFAHEIMRRFVDKLKEAFPGESPSYLWPNP